MKHMESVTIPAREEKRLDFITCDMCGERIESGDAYEVNEVEIRHKTGYSYPEGGSGQEVLVDLCAKCFDDKLVPWLRSQGVNPRVEDWDW
jgi:hypothetical protein